MVIFTPAAAGTAIVTINQCGHYSPPIAPSPLPPCCFPGENCVPSLGHRGASVRREAFPSAQSGAGNGGDNTHNLRFSASSVSTVQLLCNACIMHTRTYTETHTHKKRGQVHKVYTSTYIHLAYTNTHTRPASTHAGKHARAAPGERGGGGEGRYAAVTRYRSLFTAGQDCSLFSTGRNSCPLQCWPELLSSVLRRSEFARSATSTNVPRLGPGHGL